MFFKIAVLKDFAIFARKHLWWILFLIISSFRAIPKITSANLCKSFHDIIFYSTPVCPFESGKCGKEGKKSQKSEHLENEKTF